MADPKPAPLTGIVEVDELGTVLAALAPLKEREKELKERLKAYGHTVLEGLLFRCTVIDSIEWRLDSKAVKEEMGEEWVTAHSKTSSKTTVRVVSKTASSSR